MNSKQETWKPIRGFEGLYEVSNHGNVRGIKRSGCTGENIKGFLDRGGYRVFMLYRHGEHKHFKAHRLVATAFIPNPEHKRTVNHIDGNKQNNHVGNLEWATHTENLKHAFRTGLNRPSDKQRRAASVTGKRTCHLNHPRKPVLMMSLNGDALQRFDSAMAGARHVQGVGSGVSACCRGSKKTYKGYRWEYVNK